MPVIAFPNDGSLIYEERFDWFQLLLLSGRQPFGIRLGLPAAYLRDLVDLPGPTIYVQYRERNWTTGDPVPEFGPVFSTTGYRFMQLAAQFLIEPGLFGNVQRTWRFAYDLGPQPPSTLDWGWVHIRWTTGLFLDLQDESSTPVGTDAPEEVIWQRAFDTANSPQYNPYDFTTWYPKGYDPADQSTWPGTDWFTAQVPDASGADSQARIHLLSLWPHPWQVGLNFRQGRIPGGKTPYSDYDRPYFNGKKLS